MRAEQAVLLTDTHTVPWAPSASAHAAQTHMAHQQQHAGPCARLGMQIVGKQVSSLCVDTIDTLSGVHVCVPSQTVLTANMQAFNFNKAFTCPGYNCVHATAVACQQTEYMHGAATQQLQCRPAAALKAAPKKKERQVLPIQLLNGSKLRFHVCIHTHKSQEACVLVGCRATTLSDYCLQRTCVASRLQKIICSACMHGFGQPLWEPTSHISTCY